MNTDDILNEPMSGSISSIASKAMIADATLLPSVWTTTGVGGQGVVNMPFQTQVVDPLDKYAFNRFAVDHKVTAAELLKLQEVAPDFAKEIKENIAKNLARDIATKVSYTKKHDKDSDVHHFIGRVWVFSEEELKGILGIK